MNSNRHNHDAAPARQKAGRKDTTMKRIRIIARYLNDSNATARMKIWELEDKINELSTAWDNATDTRKRNAILTKMNALTARLEALEAI